jgi:hypothetical protein
MPDPRIDRLADLLETIAPCEPPAVRQARARSEHARTDLLRLVQRGAPSAVLQAARYRADRAQADLTDAWRHACPTPRPSR